MLLDGKIDSNRGASIKTLLYALQPALQMNHSLLRPTGLLHSPRSADLSRFSLLKQRS